MEPQQQEMVRYRPFTFDTFKADFHKTAKGGFMKIWKTLIRTWMGSAFAVEEFGGLWNFISCFKFPPWARQNVIHTVFSSFTAYFCYVSNVPYCHFKLVCIAGKSETYLDSLVIFIGMKTPIPAKLNLQLEIVKGLILWEHIRNGTPGFGPRKIVKMLFA